MNQLFHFPVSCFETWNKNQLFNPGFESCFFAVPISDCTWVLDLPLENSWTKFCMHDHLEKRSTCVVPDQSELIRKQPNSRVGNRKSIPCGQVQPLGESCCYCVDKELTLEVARKLQFYTLYPVIDLLSIKKTLSGAIFTLEPLNCVSRITFQLELKIPKSKQIPTSRNIPFLFSLGDTDFVTLLALCRSLWQTRLVSWDFFLLTKNRDPLVCLDSNIWFQLFSILQVCLVI